MASSPSAPSTHSAHFTRLAVPRRCTRWCSAMLATLPAQATDRYRTFIGGCGSADGISTTAGANAQGRFNCWADTLGGLSGQTFPTAAADVFVLTPGATSR